MNTIKKAIVLCLMIFTIFGCKPKKVEVFGTASGITDAVVEVSTNDTSWMEHINRGKFELNFNIKKEEFAQLKLIFSQKPEKTKSYFIYLEEGKYEIAFDSTNLESYPKILSQSIVQKDVATYYNLFWKTHDKRAQTEFVSRFPNSLLSAYFLSILNEKILENPKRYRDLYENLDGELKQTEYAKKAEDYIEKCLRTEIGAVMPQLYGVTPQSDSFDTSQLRGKLTLLVFWASWSKTCIKDIAELKQYYASYKSDGLEILGIALDKRESRWNDAIKSHNLNWLHIADFKGAYSKNLKQYNTNTIPYYMLIGPDLRIVENYLSLKSFPIYMREYKAQLMRDFNHRTNIIKD